MIVISSAAIAPGISSPPKTNGASPKTNNSASLPSIRSSSCRKGQIPGGLSRFRGLPRRRFHFSSAPRPRRRCPWRRPSRLRTRRAMLLLPEGRARFQKIHQEDRRLEGRLPVRRCGDDQHDVLAGRDPAVAVDGGEPGQRPALGRLARRCGRSRPRPCRDSVRARAPRACPPRRGKGRRR